MAGSGPRRPVSMADVATAAGVSISTVSHVVNKTRRVSPATELAVLEAVAHIGYVPDTVVRSMRTAGSQMIGLAMSGMSNPYFGDVIHGIDQAASGSPYSLVLTETHDEPAGELRAVSDLLTRGVEAIILAPTADPAQALHHAAQKHVPVVLIDRLTSAGIDQIGCENVEPTAQLVDHLAHIGHRRIGMISGRDRISTTIERVEGFRQGLARNGLQEIPELLVSGDSQSDVAHDVTVELLSSADPPSALVVGNNDMTIGVMRAARTAKVRVPDDLALVCFDDFEWADLFHPRLTTIAQPTRSLGAQAFAMVQTRLTNPDLPPRRVVVTPTFVHRESCGCAPAENI